MKWSVQAATDAIYQGFELENELIVSIMKTQLLEQYELNGYKAFYKNNKNLIKDICRELKSGNWDDEQSAKRLAEDIKKHNPEELI